MDYNEWFNAIKYPHDNDNDSNIMLKAVTEDFIEFCENKIVLKLETGKLKTIPYLIKHMPKLLKIDGKKNQISYISHEIVNCKGIMNITMSHNKITKLPRDICYLQQLSVLDLSANLLYELPIGLSECKKLKNVDLSNNKFLSFPFELYHCLGLKKLNLSNNEIRFISDQIENLAELEILNLSNNKLGDIPNEIKKCDKLKVLHIDNNNLMKLPLGLSKCTNLTHLYANNNELESIMHNLGNLTKLEVLDISKNNVCFIPFGIGKCVNLNMLFCEKNNIIFIPKEIQYCKKLKILSSAENSIINFPLEISKCEKIDNTCQFKFDDYTFNMSEIKKLYKVKKHLMQIKIKYWWEKNRITKHQLLKIIQKEKKYSVNMHKVNSELLKINKELNINTEKYENANNRLYDQNKDLTNEIMFMRDKYKNFNIRSQKIEEDFKKAIKDSNSFKTINKELESTINNILMTSKKEIEELTEKNNESKICKICYTNEINTYFYPCAHIACCDVCSANVNDCPFCKNPIAMRMRAYFM